MEAKDTVMTPQQIKELKSKKWCSPARNYDYTVEELMVAEAQAEVSFKAGYEQAKKEDLITTNDLVADSRKAGIKEVVEWIKNHNAQPDEILDDWQAQLKVWGIEVKND